MNVFKCKFILDIALPLSYRRAYANNQIAYRDTFAQLVQLDFSV